MFTIFEARSTVDGTPAEGLAITAWYYDSSGSRVQINAPTHIGNGKYSIHCENAGTVVLETETANIFLPVLHFQNVSGTDVSALATSAEIQAIASGKTLADLATPADVQVTVDADGIEVPTAEEVSSAVWSESSRTLTGVEGLDLPKDSELKPVLNLLFSMMGKWSVAESTLTAYSEDGSVLRTFTLTRDTDGRIIAVD